MIDSARARLQAWRAAARSDRARRALRIGAIAFVAYGVLAFFAVPLLVPHLHTHNVASPPARPVSAAHVWFNPYTLTLRIDGLRVGEPHGDATFVEVARVDANASFTSLFRLAPVLDALRVEGPHVRLVRESAETLNVSDLLAPAPAGAKPAERPASEPARYALSNLEVHGGAITLEDHVTGQTHVVDRVELGVPFLAELPSQTEIFVEPLLAFALDGSPFKVTGKTKPFAQSLESEVAVNLERLELPKYLAYARLPAGLRLEDGALSCTCRIRFVQRGAVREVKLDGDIALDEIKLADRAGAPLLAFEKLAITMREVEPLKGRAELARVALDAPVVSLARGADGALNIDALRQKPSPDAKPGEPLVLAIDALTLARGTVHWADATQAAPAELALEGVSLGVTAFDTRRGTAQWNFATNLGDGKVSARGTLEPATKKLTAELEGTALALPPLTALAQSALGAAVVTRGTLGFAAKLAADGDGGVTSEEAKLTLADFALQGRDAKATQLAWKSLEVALDGFDLRAAKAHVASATLDGLAASVVRRRDGKIDLLELLPPPASPPAPTPAWAVGVAHAALANAALKIDDASPATPVKLALDKLELTIDDLDADRAKPFKLVAKGALGKRGAFALDGTATLAPLGASLDVDAKTLDLAALAPYVASSLNVSIASANLGAKGKLTLAGEPLALKYHGDAALGAVRLDDKLSGDDFLRWNALKASAIDLDTAGERPRVAIKAIALSDFYARMIIDARGVLNLNEIVAAEGAAPTSLTRDTAGETPPPKPKPADTPVAVPTRTEPLPVDLTIGAVTLAGGRVNYTDHFVKPNFTADVGSIAGSIGAFGTTASQEPAALALKGELSLGAPVSIDGRIDPLATPAFVDLAAKADGVELTHFTPYSSKYAGFPIERGTLTMDVHYELAQGKLKADNHLFIDQLTFGAKVESPEATKLPVQLAVSLLKNAKGEIDVRIPVSGSLDDPQFSLGGVIARAFGNMLAGAVTAPFRLLAAAFGGGEDDDIASVEFAPGSAELDATAQKRLETLARALADRPSLSLDIAGRVDPEADATGLREAALAQALRAAKQAETGAAEAAEVSADEVDTYLEAAYKAAKIDKPKNAIGFSKSLPPEEMRALLLASYAAGEPELDALAQRRAETVRAWLGAKLDGKRLALAAPKKAGGTAGDEKGRPTRVEFALR
jgi:uncharacterized protein involved in outer membrane biogenesis